MDTVIFKEIRLFIFSILLIMTQVTCSQEHDLLLEGVDGKQHTLNEYIGKGKWVVVNVWATACPYCRRELFDLANFHDKHNETDAMVLGLTLDLESFDMPDKAYVTNFASTYLIDYPLLLVSGDIASKVIGIPITTVPMTFFYNPEGEMVYQFTGELHEQILEDIIRNKKPLNHQSRIKDVTPLPQSKPKH
jgi:peroxiredoxin